jgi:homoserine O-acetyltransferase
MKTTFIAGPVRLPRACAALFALGLLIAPAAPALPAAPLRTASLGDFALENGQTIRDCRLAYRTYGQLNEAKSNAVVVLTWFAGTSEGLASLMGPDAMFDTSRFFVVTIDAFGDGLSSSPSNSTQQAGDKFPTFTMRDMVRSQHELLRRELQIEHAHAVAGLSMGGMQALQWMVSYPDFMDRVVAVTGSPKLTAHDLLLWKTQLALLEANCAVAMPTVISINALHLSTPAYVMAQTSADAIDEWMRKRVAELKRLNPLDYMSQLRSLISHDIYRGSTAELVAASIKSKLLIIVSLQDRMVTPGPARELARLSRAELVTLSGDCGHLASACESELVKREVRRFLQSSLAEDLNEEGPIRTTARRADSGAGGSTQRN